MKRSWLEASALPLVLLACLGCNEGDVCKAPGKTSPCPCPEGKSGTRTCLPEHVLAACDCTGLSATKPDAGAGADKSDAANAAPTPADAASSSVDAGTTHSSAGAGGLGGDGAGNSAAGQGGGSGASAGASAGAGAGASGSGGSGEGGAAGASSDNDPYATCATKSTCPKPSSECFLVEEDALLGTPAGSVCAAPCTAVGDCSKPAGSYQAAPLCEDGFCRLDCTGEGFPPDERSCPSGMHCLAAEAARAYCFR